MTNYGFLVYTFKWYITIAGNAWYNIICGCYTCKASSSISLVDWKNRNYMQFKNITNEKKLQEKKTTNLRGKLLLSSFFATLGM